MNTIESNKLIAEFMGITPRLESPDVYSYSDQPFFTVREYTAEAVMSAIAGYVKYHSSYDWLMPVIRKLQSVTEEPEELDDLKQSLWFNDIKDVFIYVVDAIQWYNKQKQ